jgi:hypothetical protein
MTTEVKPFELRPFLDAAHELMRFDESERALQLLENLPAYYRDNPPPEAVQMRRDILASLITPHAYASIDFDAEVGRDVMDHLSRGVWIKETFESPDLFRSDGGTEALVPHVCEMGPGEYWLPLGLKKRGFDFTYHDISLLKRTGDNARALRPDLRFVDTPPEGAKRIFVAFEIIEHLTDPMEIAIEAARHCGEPEIVFLSTPLYTFAVKDDWRKKNGQPHLRAYTPQEFFNTACEIFPGYNWDLRHDQIMVLRGTKRGI